MLLKTKFYLPVLPPEHIPRTALLERLRDGLNRRLTLITAPVGFGKSTCIVELFAAIERPRQRLSLETRDGEPARFWSHVGTLELARRLRRELRRRQVAQPGKSDSDTPARARVSTRCSR